MSRPLRCRSCDGQIYAEPHTEESELGADTFVGIALKCLLCSRRHQDLPYISLTELVLFWGVPPDAAAKARWATLSFLWLSLTPGEEPPCN